MMLNKNKITILLAVCYLLGSASARAEDPPIEGTPCDDISECAADTTFMECVGNVCQCKNHEHTYFDHSDGKCHHLVGEECEEEEGMKCPINGFCDPVISFPPTCQCLPNYSETAGKKCAVPYDEDCADDSECDQDSFISCTGDPKKCRCEDSTSVYDGVRKLCVLKLKEPCKLSTPLVPAQECVSGAECKSDTLMCDCVVDLVDIGVGECRVKAGGACNETRKCNELQFLECGVDGTCGCGHSGWYDSTTCVSVAGADCKTDAVPPAQVCGPNSYCKKKMDVGTEGVCTCQFDLKPNPQGVCFLEPGQSCQPALDLCDKPGFQHCDLVTAKCACMPNDYLLVESATRCRLRANAPCSDDQPPCTTNSQCLGDPLKCICNGGLEINSIGKCTVPYGSACYSDSKETCDAEGFQHCSQAAGNTCTCFNEESMVHTGQKCYLKADGDCINGFECAPNSVCDDNNKCVCNAGFQNVDGLCVPTANML